MAKKKEWDHPRKHYSAKRLQRRDDEFEGWMIGHDYNRGVSQRFTGAKKGKLATKKKDKKWIQKASASIKKRGTEGVCTGDKFGGPSCPPGSRRYNLAKVFKGMARKKKKAATGAMIKAKTSTFAETHASNWAKRRAASTTAMTLPANIARATKGTTGMAKLVKGFKNVLGVLPAGAAASKFKKAVDPSKFLSRAKTLSTGLGKRSVALAGGPIGLGMYAGTMGAKAAVTHAFKGYKKDGKWTKEGMKRLESEARSREALMAKRNKARNAKTGKMVKAVSGNEVLGKDSVPFKSLGTHANLADERQGRKGAAVTGFNFKGVF